MRERARLPAPRAPPPELFPPEMATPSASAGDPACFACRPIPRAVTARSPFYSFPRSIAQIMNDIDGTLKEAYNATSTIVMPGSAPTA